MATPATHTLPHAFMCPAPCTLRAQSLSPPIVSFNVWAGSRVNFQPDMLTAVTRAVSPAIVNCELTFVARQPIDFSKARDQHRAYEQRLEKLGARIISLPAEPTLPDSMFVEDPAIVLDELA